MEKTAILAQCLFIAGLPEVIRPRSVDTVNIGARLKSIMEVDLKVDNEFKMCHC